jgi:hypothetical protein
MNDSANHRSLIFLTPTFARDYERFCLQRESMRRCGIDIPHIAVVHDEDLAVFKQTPHRNNLTLLSTADVLPAIRACGSPAAAYTGGPFSRSSNSPRRN